MTAMTDSPALPGMSPPSTRDSAPNISVATAPKRTRRALVALPLLAAIGVGIGGSVYLLGRGHETTNDAQVEGHVASVAARVTGQVKEVRVNDNQSVAAGDVLVVLDDRDLVAKVAAARADLAAATAQRHAAETELRVTRASTDSNLAVARGGISQANAIEGTTRASIERAGADLTAADSRLKLARVELDRTQTLLTSGVLSQAEFDVKQAAFEQAEAAREQARAALSSAQANVHNSSGTLASARGRLLAAESGPAQIEAGQANLELAGARVAQAQAALDRAELELSYTSVRAGVAGVVSRRSVEVGQLVSPDRALMAVVPLDDTWVVANFKEDQIAQMHPGQTARVHVDTYDHELEGHVDSLASGTGSRFSLLPPDNASGNFTKVVQRVPVLIRLEPHPDLVLRPGMSVTASVDIQ